MSQADSGFPGPSDPLSDPSDPPAATQVPRPTSRQNRTSRLIFKVLFAPALLAVVIFLVMQAWLLWGELAGLQSDLHLVQKHAVIGYLNIAPVSGFDEGPKNWYRVEGDQAYLWFGWDKESDHRWFRFAAGEIDPRRLYRPTSEFIAHAIDFPLVETQGGTIWQRMPAEAPVVGYKIENRVCVYPVAILGKVIVINDIVDQHPYMVVVNPFARPVVAFSIYDAMLEGHRVTLGHTGYFREGKPILFDRGTESLWFEMHDGLTAIAGKHFKKRLMRIAIPSPVSWETWLSKNPESRLLVGADRSLGIPKE